MVSKLRAIHLVDIGFWYFALLIILAVAGVMVGAISKRVLSEEGVVIGMYLSVGALGLVVLGVMIGFVLLLFFRK